MKKLFVILSLLLAGTANSQAPQYLNYQAVARDASGTIVTTAIGIKFEILQGSASGTVVYDETNNITPSSAGVFTAAIGNGTPVTGIFSSINWANSPYFIRVSIDPAGGTSYSTVGTSQLLSVPYALYAEKAGNSQTLTAGSGINISSGVISNASPNQTVNISGPAVSGSYPNYTITTPSAPTASTGISIVGGTVTNTAPDQTVTISGATGTYPNFTVTSTPPTTITAGNSNISVTGSDPNFTITSVPSLSLSGAQLSISNGNTVTLPTGTTYTNGAGIALTSGTIITNTAPNQTVTVANGTNVTVNGTYPNYTVNATPTLSLATNVLSISGGNSVTLPSPPTPTAGAGISIISGTITNTAPNQTVNITGAGVGGTYPNYTVTSAPSTSITSGGANVVVNGSAPSYTVSATTPNFQVNTPHTTTTLSLNSYSLNIAPTNITGAGVASVSGTYPNYSVTVPAPSISTTGNTITISQGTAVTTATLPGGPWMTTTGVLHPAANPTNDKVAIGGTSASSRLDVQNSAGSTLSVSPVASVINSNAAFTASGVLDVKNNAGGGAAIFAEQNGNIGDGISINVNGATNNGNALQVQNFGLGKAGYFGISNASNTSRVIDATTNGTGMVISAVNTNSLNSSNALFVSTNGPGTTASFNKTGSGNVISANHSGSSGSAGFFNLTNASNSAQALTAQASGNGDALAAYNVGNGRGLYATASGSVESAYFTNSGTGRALQVANSGATEAAYIFNTGNASALIAYNTGSVEAVNVNSSGNARGMIVLNNSPTFETVLLNNSSNGRGLVVQNPSASPNKAAQIVGGLDIVGKTAGSSTFALVVTNSSIQNLFNVRDDGHVGIGNPSPNNRLNVSESMAITAMQVQNSNATGGGAARFDISSNTNPADAVFIQNIGTGASIHASNGPAAGSALSLWVENGHIKSTSSAAPASFTITVAGGFTTPGFAPTCVGTDVKGVISFSTSATGFSAVNSFDIQYNFQKAYSVAPTVILTPKSDFKGLSFMVLSSSPSNFVVRIYRPNGASFPTTIGNTFFDFNYFIIE